jgi:putative hydrolase of the HAD superfamily
MTTAHDTNFNSLDRTIGSDADYQLALRHAPYIRFDDREPFLPSVVGYTIFRESGASASFPRQIHLDAEVATVIEYAIWWDWDIGHLYELEHVWVYVNPHGGWCG